MDAFGFPKMYKQVCCLGRRLKSGVERRGSAAESRCLLVFRVENVVFSGKSLSLVVDSVPVGMSCWMCFYLENIVIDSLHYHGKVLFDYKNNHHNQLIIYLLHGSR